MNEEQNKTQLFNCNKEHDMRELKTLSYIIKIKNPLRPIY